jgi:hypothetical protein
MNVYWFICVREAYPSALPRVVADQKAFNRQASNALGGLLKRRHAVGDLLARPIPDAILDHLLCDGSAIPRVSFPQLFAAIGTEWGAGDGATTFNLPNLLVADLPNATTAPDQIVTDTTAGGGDVTVPGGSGETGGSTGGGVSTGGRPPPVGTTPPSGSSSTAIANSFNSISTTTHVPITPELSVVVGASGTVTLDTDGDDVIYADLTVRTNPNAPTGTFKVWGKWQWWDGTAWADVAAEVSTTPDVIVSFTDSYQVDPGVLIVNTSKTGLTPGSNAKFRLMARNDSGTRLMMFGGKAAATS